MRRFAALIVLSVLSILPSKASATSRQVDEILDQVVPIGSSSMNVAVTSGSLTVSLSTSPSSVPSFQTLLVSTGAVTDSGSSLIMPARATRGGHVLVNECANPIRIGPSSVTGTVGLYVAAGGVVNIDPVVGPHRGELYGINTAVGSCSWSILEVLP